MDWLGRMLHLPDFFLFSNQSKGGGVIQGTASEATLVSMLSARSKMIREHNNNDRILSKLVAYASEQSHSSISKAALLAAVRMRLLRADNNLSLRGSALQKAIEEDKEKGFIPFFVVATLGTTNTCSFDNLKEIGEICKLKRTKKKRMSLKNSFYKSFMFFFNLFISFSIINYLSNRC